MPLAYFDIVTGAYLDGAMFPNDEAGALPIHNACAVGAGHFSWKAIKLLIAGPFHQTLGMVDNDGQTPLHCLCGRRGPPAPREDVEKLFNYFPVACLIRNNDGDTPFDLYPDEMMSWDDKLRRLAQVIGALVELAYMPNTMLQEDVVNHIKELYPATITSTPWKNLLLTRQQVDQLLNHDALQTALKQESVQTFVNGLVRMNRAGRLDIDPSQPAAREISVRVLVSVRDNPDMIFVFAQQYLGPILMTGTLQEEVVMFEVCFVAIWLWLLVVGYSAIVV